jgi:hypothetical protein
MLLGFKKQFAPKILDGSKKFTIRNPRKVEPKIGDQLHMYTGLRTKSCEKISSEHTLKGIQLVDLMIQKQVNGTDYLIVVFIDGRPLDSIETQDFVRCDGFNDEEDFIHYWMDSVKEKITRKGFIRLNIEDLIIYHWTDLRF